MRLITKIFSELSNINDAPLHLARRCRGPNVPPHSHPRLRFMAFHPIISSLALLLIIVLLIIVLLVARLVGLLILLA